jgi:hypothetical protein
MALKKPRTILLPEKDDNPKIRDIGRPHRQASIVANPDT